MRWLKQQQQQNQQSQEPADRKKHSSHLIRKQTKATPTKTKYFTKAFLLDHTIVFSSMLWDLAVSILWKMRANYMANTKFIK